MDLNQRVLVNGQLCDKAKEKLGGGERVAIDAEMSTKRSALKRRYPLLFMKMTISGIINKPRDLAGTSPRGNPDGTVLNALLSAIEQRARCASSG